jgi:integrase
MARETTGQVVERKGKRGITYAARVRAYGERHYLTLGYSWDGYTRRRADTELQNVLADIRRGTWQPPQPAPAPTPAKDPTFHEFASQWLDGLRHELAPRTVEDYELALTHHLLPFFKNHRLSQITAQETDRYKTAKVREREQGTVERPLSNRTINKTLTRLGRSEQLSHERHQLGPEPWWTPRREPQLWVEAPAACRNRETNDGVVAVTHCLHVAEWADKDAFEIRARNQRRG